MATIDLCRCGKPLIHNGLGSVFCEHCDRADCKGPSGGCVDCHLFDKATKEHAAKTIPKD